MVQSPSWEANWFAASHEIPRISQNPKVHYRIHKRPLPVSILGQPNAVHIPTSHLLEIHPHPSMPRSPQWSLSLWFPHQDPIHPPLLTHTQVLYILSVSVALAIHHANNAHCSILSSVACPALPYFPTLSHKQRGFLVKTVLNIKCVFWFNLKFLSETFLILRIIQLNINIHRYWCEVPFIFARF